MMRLPLATVALLAGVLLLPNAGADVLQVPEQAPGTAAASRPEYAMEMPTKGMSMTQVETRFGQPQERLAPVGDPPITRWIYPDYTVYFEYQYVINSVLHR